MKIKFLTENDQEWFQMIEYAKHCSWKAGQSLANKMENDYFVLWQRVIVVFDGKEIAGFCTFTKEDSLINVSYSPFIGYIFVDENYRGCRLSERMIDFVCLYAKSLEFKHVYITTDHDQLYEKYGFEYVDKGINRKGNIEKIYMKEVL